MYRAQAFKNFVQVKSCLAVFFGLLICTSQGYAGDPVAGEKAFVKCKVCHEVEPDKSKIVFRINLG